MLKNIILSTVIGLSFSVQALEATYKVGDVYNKTELISKYNSKEEAVYRYTCFENSSKSKKDLMNKETIKSTNPKTSNGQCKSYSVSLAL